MQDIGLPLDPAVESDLMNDPKYDNNLRRKQTGVEDVDTCRICRGEGSKDEPLFYPCKCNGSIKFVHQTCLMEWLSHSQKKHCELCKTPFRFTKLYHPHMPNAVPLPVFLRQAIVHTWKTFLTWARFHLVLFVWVAWLPWCMRTVWRGLFWVGDGGWINWQKTEERARLVAQQHLDSLAAQGTSPAGIQFLRPTDSAASGVLNHVANSLPRFLAPVSKTFNLSTAEPTVFKLARKLIMGAIGRQANETLIPTAASGVIPRSVSDINQRSGSWLSDLKFLRSLTRSPTVNGIVTDTLEGQLITLLVVIAFILVFLIREWVVQQQPNLGQLANGEPAVAPVGDVPVVEHLARPNAEEFRWQAHGDQLAAEVDNQGEPPAEQALRPRLPIRPRARRRARRPTDTNQENRDHVTQNGRTASRSGSSPHSVPQAGFQDYQSIDQFEMEPISRRASVAGSSTSPQRPGMPTRDTLARAAEIRRTLEEHSRASGQKDWPGLKVFMDLWNRAESKPSEVLRIIEEEGRRDELGWIVAAMNRLENTPTAYGDQNLSLLASGSHKGDESSDNAIEHKMEGSSCRSKSLDGNQKYHDKAHRVASTEHFLKGQKKTGPSFGYDFVETRKTQNHDSTDVSLSLLSEDDTNQLYELSNQSSSASLKPSTFETYVGDVAKQSHWRQRSVSRPGSHDESNPFPPEYLVDGFQDEHKLHSSPEVANLPDQIVDLHLTEEENPSAFEHVHDDSLNETLLPDHPDISVGNLNLGDKLMDWLWGGVNSPMNQAGAVVEQQGGDDEHIVRNIADEAPFVPVEHGQLPMEDTDNEENPAQDPDVVAAAVQAGLIPEGVDVVDDGEDLEGIMELVGMQGPLAGLIQNGMFCAVLVSMTIFLGMWIPYIAGKVFLVFLANPVSLLFKLPLRWASISADLIIDLCVFGAGCAFYWADTVIRFLCAPVEWVVPALSRINQNRILAETAMGYAEDAMERLAKTFLSTGDSVFESDIPTFSIIAHESLRLIELRFTRFTKVFYDTVIAALGLSSMEAFSFGGLCRSLSTSLLDLIKTTSSLITQGTLQLINLMPSLFKINPLRVNLKIPQRTSPLDFSLAYWDTKDRILAIIFGYVFFSLLGLVYLRICASLRGRNGGGRVDGAFADVLYQAGGVLKVILIISIEMIAFPLYCGLLLDIALLPLFGDVTVMSRFHFLLNSPNTSLFVHWFVGTCYMFHFALFVSMCRKIMRKGVLYFIRDPDDATFHPVRDVLERSVSTQLRKIAFSALVYGALVILCLGGVVWGLYLAFDTVFPIHWSSNDPVLEFPVDLLFYNFLMPVAVKFFNPSAGLNSMYNWWFRKCARALRLTHFLFGKREEDEEGHHVRRTWKDWLWRKQGDSQKPVVGSDLQVLAEGRDNEVFFLRDGRYVLTPASDQVRIPKGVNTFLDVTEEGVRADGLPDSDQGLHGSNNEMFSKVYIPPFFRVRISLFILLIWLFAATTGVCITILPLVFGRLVFANLIPDHRRMNDIYAFSIGLYLLGGFLYALLHYRQLLNILRASLAPKPNSNSAAFLRQTIVYAGRLFRIIYTYFSFAVVLPSLISLVIEFYINIPMHTYFGNPTDRHIIHFIQDWTLGVLYLKTAGRVIIWYAPSRPADALRGIVRDGWLNPDARLATRSFIFPASLLMSLALTIPLALGWAANHLLSPTTDQAFQTCVYRYSYPAVLALGLLFVASYLFAAAFRGWRQRIRDEVYLIGERLHNFGERKGVGARVAGKRIASRG